MLSLRQYVITNAKEEKAIKEAINWFGFNMIETERGGSKVISYAGDERQHRNVAEAFATLLTRE